MSVPPPSDASPWRQRDVVFASHADAEAVRQELSAIAGCGKTLFLAGDETGSIVQCVRDRNDTHFREIAQFPLSAVFPLPEGPDGEIDIEGLDIHDGWLWVTGSHSLKRKKPKGSYDIAALEKTKTDENRQLLARIPLREGANGIFSPVATLQEWGAETLRAQCLPFAGKNSLRALLKDHRFLAPFLDLPSKENGLDIEGITARGEMVWLGLRGPVIGRHAIILGLDLCADDQATDGLACRKQPVDRVITYALDLDGYGIRDLCLMGDDLLILAGPTMGNSGFHAVYKVAGWPAPMPVVTREDITLLIELPPKRSGDHAEGLCMIEEGDTRWLLIAFDAPHDQRLSAPGRVVLDAYPLGK